MSHQKISEVTDAENLNFTMLQTGKKTQQKESDLFVS